MDRIFVAEVGLFGSTVFTFLAFSNVDWDDNIILFELGYKFAHALHHTSEMTQLLLGLPKKFDSLKRFLVGSNGSGPLARLVYVSSGHSEYPRVLMGRTSLLWAGLEI